MRSDTRFRVIANQAGDLLELWKLNLNNGKGIWEELPLNDYEFILLNEECKAKGLDVNDFIEWIYFKKAQ